MLIFWICLGIWLLCGIIASVLMMLDTWDDGGSKLKEVVEVALILMLMGVFGLLLVFGVIIMRSDWWKTFADRCGKFWNKKVLTSKGGKK